LIIEINKLENRKLYEYKNRKLVKFPSCVGIVPDN